MAPGLIESIHGLPNIFIWLLIVIVNLLLFIVLPLSVRRLLKIEIAPEIARGADDAFKNTVTLTMALIAFSLVQVEGLHRNVADLVSREGAILLKFDRTLQDHPGPVAASVERPLRAYVSSVIQAEWPAMAGGDRSLATTTKLAALSASIGQLDQDSGESAALLGELKGQFIQLKDIREARLATSHMNLSPYFWWGILAAMTSLMVLGWFQTPVEKAIPYVSGIAIGLSTLLSILIVSSGIFEGESRVRPDALQRTLALMDAPQAMPARPSSTPSGR